ncbi:MAG: hypothetical protein KF819_08450 [Labilithrix sp.]|nr:hypothetical protein [Labilithrix sp.]
MARWLAAAFALAIFVAASPAAAQDANGFGQKGGLILSVDRLMPFLSFSSVTSTEVRGGNTVKTSDAGASMVLLLGREPTLGAVHTIPRLALDYAVIDHLTIGGSFALGLGLSASRKVSTTPNAGGNTTVQDSDQPRTTIVGFAPRVGYVIPIGRVFGFWPRLGFALYSVSTSEDIVNNVGDVVRNDSTSDVSFSLDLDPQLLWVPTRHFFVHFGPVLNLPLTGSRSRTETTGNTASEFNADLSVFHFGISAGLGTWFDL